MKLLALAVRSLQRASKTRRHLPTFKTCWRRSIHTDLFTSCCALPFSNLSRRHHQTKIIHTNNILKPLSSMYGRKFLPLPKTISRASSVLGLPDWIINASNRKKKTNDIFTFQINNNTTNNNRSLSTSLFNPSKKKYKYSAITTSKSSYNSGNSNNNKHTITQFKQRSEIDPAKHVIIHEPHLDVFFGSLHPSGFLYERPTNRDAVKISYKNLRNALIGSGIKVHNVNDILCENRELLLSLACDFLEYSYNGNVDNISSDEVKYKISKEYKVSVLDSLSNEDLVDIIMARPKITLNETNINTGMETETIETRPLANMTFTRDQQIITNSGVVIGRMNSGVREYEINVMKAVFKCLGIEIIGEIPINGRLEGGDYFPVNEDLSLLGVGIRTNIDAAKYLMDNDLLGTNRFGIVIDNGDLNQDRMHLDTIFNILNDKNVVLEDLKTIPGYNKSMERNVELYEKSKGGKYELVKKYNLFEEFLKDEGFNIVSVNHEDQLAYMINYLNIGNGKLISINRGLQTLLDINGLGNEIKTQYVEFDGVKAMYGGAHCSTQVSRI